MTAAVQELLAILDLEQLEHNLFRGRSPDTSWQRVFGGQTIAQALVAVTRLQRDAAVGREALEAFGFGEQPLEVRVQRLLAGGPLDRWRACALPTAAVLAACTCAIALQQAPAIHHAVETLLHLLF